MSKLEYKYEYGSGYAYMGSWFNGSWVMFWGVGVCGLGLVCLVYMVYGLLSMAQSSWFVMLCLEIVSGACRVYMDNKQLYR